MRENKNPKKIWNIKQKACIRNGWIVCQVKDEMEVSMTQKPFYANGGYFN